MSLAPRFLAIRASAGSGKTFRLAHRYIRLLAEGVPPDQIVALTFTRKAAGEIFDAVTGYIAAACLSDAEAERADSRLGDGAPQLTASDYVAMLRRLLDEMHRLHIGTIDSFAVRVVKSFPLELGVPASFELMDGDDAATLSFRRRILDQMFAGGARGADRHRLLSAFQQARTGRSGRGVEALLAAFVAEYQERYRVLPDAGRWGEPSAIWPDGSPWREPNEGIETVAEGFRASLAGLGLSGQHRERFDDFAAAASSFSAYAGWEGPVKYMMEKLLPCVDGLRRGLGKVKLNRTEYELTGEAARLALALVTHVIAVELDSAMTRTRGIYHLLDLYDSLYDAAARSEGRLTFADVQHLLTGHGMRGSGAALSGLASAAETEASRLYIDYRLDAHLNHWMLDEFQDTSDLQWDILGNLVDEVLQDDTGARSFFYVGDVKQAIYGWRGGNPDLFEMLLRRYPSIQEDTLQLSRRSAQPVIDMVNTVFRELPGAPDLPAGLARRWRFDEHATVHGSALEGCAMLLETTEGADDAGPDAARYRLAAGLLRDIEPARRRRQEDGATPLTTAVLVRTNEQGKALVDLLRRECPNITVIHEGRAAIRDNPVVAVLLALVTLAAHPGNALAWRHLQMSPLGASPDAELESRGALSRRLLRQLQAHGFRSLLRDWGARLDSACRLDAWGRKRLAELLAAATEFDARGGRDCDEFLEFVNAYTLHEQAADDAVRVMTVHQSKGLEFDIVILPELDDRLSMSRSRDTSFALARDAGSNRPLWALELPRRDVTEADPTLLAQLEKMHEDAALESLCLLYVAMTRARRALYVVTTPPGRTATAFTQPAFMQRQLGGSTRPAESGADTFSPAGLPCACLYETGNRWWYRHLPYVEEVPAPTGETIIERPAGPVGQRRLVAVRPSDADDMETTAAALFDEGRRRRREMGSAVHAVLECVEWLEDAAAFVNPSTPAEVDAGLWESACEHVREALRRPKVANVFRRPAGSVTLWRERRFDVVRQQQWITGSFDRVVIQRDEQDRAVHATIFDFKTDDITEPGAVSVRSAHYRPQMQTYCAVLARMLSIDPKHVSLVLVFTGPGAVYRIA